MFPFLFWLATRDDTRNKEAKKELRNIEHENEAEKKEAQKIATARIIQELDHFIKKHNNCDVIIDTSSSDFFKLPSSYKKMNNIYESRIFYDKIEISGSQDYTNRNVTLGIESISVGGNLTGFSVSETSSGYNISPDYSSSSTAKSYVLKDNGSSQYSVYDNIYVKAVKSGTAENVIEKEKELFIKKDRYILAKKYEKNSEISALSKNIEKKESSRYNIFSFIGEIIFLILILLIPLSISNNEARKRLLPAMMYDAIFGHTVIWLNYSLYFIAFLYLVLIICFAVMTHIKKNFIKNNGVWYDGNRGAFNYHDVQKEYLNLSFANEWQDCGRFKLITSRLIYSSVILTVILLSFFLQAKIPTLHFCIAILLDIIIILWLISFLFKSYNALYCLIKNPNYYRSQQYKKIMQDFISDNGCEKYENLIKEIHECTVSKS